MAAGGIIIFTLALLPLGYLIATLILNHAAKGIADHITWGDDPYSGRVLRGEAGTAGKLDGAAGQAFDGPGSTDAITRHGGGI